MLTAAFVVIVAEIEREKKCTKSVCKYFSIQ
jgi:hypothetical protein